MTDPQCAVRTEHGIRCSNAAVSGSLCRHHNLVELSRSPEGRAYAEAAKRDMDERWRRDTIETILERPDAAEIVAELARTLEARERP